LIERGFVNMDIHIKALNSKDARGKYEYLAKIAPEMIKRAKLGHIASIIGVTQETLTGSEKAYFLIYIKRKYLVFTVLC
jgi:hypothetical protein